VQSLRGAQHAALAGDFRKNGQLAKCDMHAAKR
jgi:hypothetical protein